MTPRELIKTIHFDKGNLDHIAKTGNINGSLMMDIESRMNAYAIHILEDVKKEISVRFGTGNTFDDVFNQKIEELKK